MDILVVDANPLLSALLGGTAREVILSGKFVLYSPQQTLFEVAKYLEYVSKRLRRPEDELFREFQLLPITPCQPREYDAHAATARQLIGNRDPRDVPVVALSLQLGCPIWTEDRDFDNLPGITILRTADLLAVL